MKPKHPRKGRDLSLYIPLPVPGRAPDCRARCYYESFYRQMIMILAPTPVQQAAIQERVEADLVRLKILAQHSDGTVFWPASPMAPIPS